VEYYSSKYHGAFHGSKVLNRLSLIADGDKPTSVVTEPSCEEFYAETHFHFSTISSSS
jgi:hypothetical protein